MSETGNDTWHKVASYAALEPDYPICVKVDARELALCRVDDAVFAIDNVCSHAFARLSDGWLEGFALFCPLHGGSFDVRTGAVMSPPCMDPVAVFECRVEGDVVLVRLVADD